MDHEPAAHAELEVGGTAMRKPMSEGSALIRVLPEASVVISPDPGMMFRADRNARWSDPEASQQPLVACQLKSGMESGGNEVTPLWALQTPEHASDRLWPTVSAPELEI
jgi:hypothetical protein